MKNGELVQKERKQARKRVKKIRSKSQFLPDATFGQITRQKEHYSGCERPPGLTTVIPQPELFGESNNVAVPAKHG